MEAWACVEKAGVDLVASGQAFDGVGEGLWLWWPCSFGRSGNLHASSLLVALASSALASDLPSSVALDSFPAVCNLVGEFPSVASPDETFPFEKAQ